MILDCAHDAWMIRPISNRGLEDNSLVVALTLSFGLDAVGTGWSLLATLDTSLPAGQAPSLGPFPHLWVGRSGPDR